MYSIRRVFEVKPGTDRRAATLIQQQAAMYTDAGQRAEVQVYFNGGTLPGDTNRVYSERTAEVIDSPYRRVICCQAMFQEQGRSSGIS